MKELTFSDIFIGENGIVVLISAMILALLGNLFKKYKRYQARDEDERNFEIKHWLKDNADDMVVGFFATYILVRLISTVAKYALDLAEINDPVSGMNPSDSVVLVSILIGYYTDSILAKFLK
mgnify:CR=1 FL=1